MQDSTNQSTPFEQGAIVMGRISREGDVLMALAAIRAAVVIENAVLTVHGKNARGRVGIASNQVICGAALDTVPVTGANAVAMLLSQASGVYAMRPAVRKEITELSGVQVDIDELFNLANNHPDLTISKVVEALTYQPPGQAPPALAARTSISSVRPMPAIGLPPEKRPYVEWTDYHVHRAAFPTNKPIVLTAALPPVPSDPTLDAKAQAKQDIDRCVQLLKSAEESLTSIPAVPAEDQQQAWLQEVNQLVELAREEQRRINAFKQTNSQPFPALQPGDAPFRQTSQPMPAMNPAESGRQTSQPMAAMRPPDSGRQTSQPMAAMRPPDSGRQTSQPMAAMRPPDSGRHTSQPMAAMNAPASGRQPSQPMPAMQPASDDPSAADSNQVAATGNTAPLPVDRFKPYGGERKSGELLIPGYELHPEEPLLTPRRMIVGAVASVLCLAVTIFCMCLSMRQSQYEAAVNRARELCRTGRLVDVATALADWSGNWPNPAVALLYRGMSDGMRDVQKAEKDLQQCAIGNSAHLADMVLAAGKFRAGDFAQCKKLCDQVLTRRTNEPSVYFLRGMAEEKLGQAKEAISDFDRARQYDAGNIAFDACMETAAIERQRHQYGRAVAALTNIIQTNKDFNALMLRGQIYADQGQYKLALQDFSQAIDARDKPIEAYLERAKTLVQLREYEQALADCQKALKIERTSLPALTLHASICEKIGDYAGASQDYRLAVSISPKDAHLREALQRTNKHTGAAAAPAKQAKPH
jgi:tetratricopeptide (TPR) repeat protein